MYFRFGLKASEKSGAFSIHNGFKPFITFLSELITEIVTFAYNIKTKRKMKKLFKRPVKAKKEVENTYIPPDGY